MKMFTAERVGFILLIASVIAFAIIALTRGCGDVHQVGANQPDNVIIATVDSITANDSVGVAKTDSTKLKKKKKTSKPRDLKKTGDHSFKRSHLDETF